MTKYKILSNTLLGSPIKHGNNSYHVVGAGISGLLIGFYLKQAQIPFTIYEKTDRAGGLIQSHQNTYGLTEQAANAILWSPCIQEICNIIGLDLLPSKQLAKARYLVRNKKLSRFPLSILETIELLIKLFKNHTETINTVQDFGHIFFGKAATQQILEPAFAGIYGAHIQNLSFSGALPSLAKELNYSKNMISVFWNWKIKNNNKKHFKKGSHSFKGGMGTFVLALSKYLEDHIQYNINAESINLENKEVILTCPAYIAKSFFNKNTRIYKLLGQVQYTPIITMTFFFKRKQLKRFKAGFGCLIPRNEDLNILGVLFNNNIFEYRIKQKTHVSLTCILRDDSFDFSFMNQSDEKLVVMALKDLNSLFVIEGEALHYNLFRWKKGIPLYTQSLYESWFELNNLLKTTTPSIRLFGNYTGKIAIRGMSAEARLAILGKKL